MAVKLSGCTTAVEATRYDFGFGIKKCQRCGKRPIRNRGCKCCLARVCSKCFPHHACTPGQQVIKNIFETIGADTSAWAVHSATDAQETADSCFINKDVQHDCQNLDDLSAGCDSSAFAERALGEGVTWRCKKGMKPGHLNQDSFSVLQVKDQFSLYAVYDGHGPNGEVVSEYAKNQLVERFVKNPRRHTDPGRAFKESFKSVQLSIQSHPSLRASADFSGTTVTMAYHNHEQDVLTVAHVGDSRAVLACVSDNAEPTIHELTADHRPNLPSEMARIEAKGGCVMFDGDNHRVYAQRSSLPALNMSRAIGDVTAHTVGVSAEPDIKVVDLAELRNAGTEIKLLVCTDGVWEFINSTRAIEIVQKKKDDVMEDLVTASYSEWMRDCEGQYADDITGILAVLPGMKK